MAIRAARWRLAPAFRYLCSTKIGCGSAKPIASKLAIGLALAFRYLCRIIEKEMDKNNAPKEFDMLASIGAFFQSIRKGVIVLFKTLKQFLFWVLNIHIRYFFLFLALYAICLFAGFRQKSTTLVYEGQAAFLCNGFDNFLLDKTVNGINQMISRQEYGFLAKELGLPEEDCRNIGAITLGVGYDTDNDQIANEVVFKDKFKPDQYEKPQIVRTREEGEKIERLPRSAKISNTAFLRLSVNCNSAEYFLKIADTLVDYLNRMPSLARAYENYLGNLRFSLDLYHAQIRSLDSLQKTYRKSTEAQIREKDYGYLSLLASNNNLTGKEIKELSQPVPVFYEEILDLAKERNELNRDLELATAPLSVISGFSPSSLELSSKWLGKSILSALLIAIAIGALLDFRKDIAAHIRNERKKRPFLSKPDANAR